mgnify:FL=1
MASSKPVNNFMITEAQYKDMPEYWDYQRKIEYNKEKCMKACEKIMEHFGDMEEGHDAEDMFQTMWHKIGPEDYDDPPLDWIPKNKQLRLEHEK